MHQFWRYVIALAAVLLVWRTFYTVDETQHAVVTEFGSPRYSVQAAGLHVKLPWRSALRVDRRVRLYDPVPSELLTKDKKNLLADLFICWRVADPLAFMEKGLDTAGVQDRLLSRVLSRLSSQIGSVELTALLSTEHDAVQTEEIMATITREANDEAAQDLAVEVRYVGLQRLNFPQQNRPSVFERMRSERSRMAMQYRAEGRKEATVIRARANTEKERVLAEAYRDAEKVRGLADSQVTRTYSAAHNADPGFYKLVRTLDAYDGLFAKDTTIILSADSELLELMTRGRPGAR